MEKYIPLKDVNNIRLIGIRITKTNVNKAIDIGFSKDLKIGEELLPKEIGAITRFNSKGKILIDKNEKELRDIYRPYHIKDWHGQYHDGIAHEIRDLYIVVHEDTHSMDLEKGETESRTIFGEIAPQCMERLLDEFLLDMSDNDMQKYGFDRDTLIRDVRHRIVSTFLDRKDITRKLNKGAFIDQADQKKKTYSFKEKREFIDITLLILQKSTLKEITGKFVQEIKGKEIVYIVAPEARGFLFGTAVANELNIGCVPVRKKGKLPPTTVIAIENLGGRVIGESTI